MTSTLHNATTLAASVGLAAAAYFAIAYPVWRITYARRTRARYGRGK